ncbi:hypothetical protein LWI29_004302 [Acer saccharum]|uniref:Uncharacterized protein n=1 Tax=Acer saccharum TaxID=4024 RepID=A0AA39W805_ACESA|nr:hypothetical protein LWI29_004302 [Acer saccharum]
MVNVGDVSFPVKVEENIAPVDFKWLTELLSLKLNSSKQILEKLPDVKRHDSLSWNGACKVSSLALVDDERAVGDGDNCDQIKSKDKKGSKGVGELCNSKKGIRSRCSGRKVVNGCHSKIFLEMAAKEERFQWASDMGSNSLSSIIESSQGEFSNFELLRGESCIRKDYDGLNFSKHVGVGLVSSNNIVRGLTNMGSDPGMSEGPLRGKLDCAQASHEGSVSGSEKGGDVQVFIKGGVNKGMSSFLFEKLSRGGKWCHSSVRHGMCTKNSKKKQKSGQFCDESSTEELSYQDNKEQLSSNTVDWERNEGVNNTSKKRIVKSCCLAVKGHGMKTRVRSLNRLGSLRRSYLRLLILVLLWVLISVIRCEDSRNHC